MSAAALGPFFRAYFYLVEDRHLKLTSLIMLVANLPLIIGIVIASPPALPLVHRQRQFPPAGYWATNPLSSRPRSFTGNTNATTRRTRRNMPVTCVVVTGIVAQWTSRKATLLV